MRLDPSAPVLSGVRVLDLSDSLAGQFAARLLADQGAAVTLMRRPGTSWIESMPPFAHPPGGLRESLLFRHLNYGKTVRATDRQALPELVRTWAEEPAAHRIVVVSDQDCAETVRSTGPSGPPVSLAVAADFAEGPYARWSGTELVHQALSGSMHYNGREGQQPLFGTGHRASYAAGFLLYSRVVSEMLALARGRDAAAEVRVNVHEAAAVMEQNFSTQWAYSASIAARGEWNRPKGRVRCRDGWVVFFAMGDRQRELFRTFGADEALSDPRFATWTDFVTHIADACALFTERCRDRTQAELLASALAHRLVLSPVRTLNDLAHEEHLQQRQYWPDPGSTARLGPVWRWHEDGAVSVAAARGADTAGTVGPGRAGGAASIGESRSAVGSATTVASASTGRQPTPGWTGGGPLSNLRVVDLSAAWSGPMATRILAALGAEVIKIEGPLRMDGWRGPVHAPTHLDSYPSGEPGTRPYNRNAWFNTQNPGKKSVAIDVRTDSGRDLALGLIARSELVIANFTPGTLDRLGLGLSAARRVNPRITVVEMSGFGDSGPLREHRGLGQTMEAMSGITSLIGYDDGEPLGSGSAYLDPMGGLAGAAAAVTGLLRSIRTGQAHRLDVPQREAAMQWIGEHLLDVHENGTSYRPQGNRVEYAYPHDAYPARGQDEWITVAVSTDDQWQALCRVCGWPRWQNDPQLRTIAGRREHAPMIDAALSRFTRHRDKADLAQTLQDAGVPAAPVLHGRDLFEDPQLRARGWFTHLPHAEVGDCDYPGVPVEIDGVLTRPRHAAPRFAQNTEEVLGGVLGLDGVQLRRLTDSGVIACATALGAKAPGAPPRQPRPSLARPRPTRETRQI